MPAFKFSRHYALLAIALFCVEVIIATKLKHLTFVRNSLGDFLVVMLLYCMAKTVYPFHKVKLTLSIFVFACFIELLQYFHIADRLQLSQNGAARIITGTQFSFEDIAMYAGGCWLAYLLDGFFSHQSQ